MWISFVDKKYCKVDKVDNVDKKGVILCLCFMILANCVKVVGIGNQISNHASLMSVFLVLDLVQGAFVLTLIVDNVL